MEKRSASRPSRRIKERSGPATNQEVKATLADVRRLIGVDAEPVASVLPEAIAKATEERSQALSVALEPTVSRTIRVVASRDSEWFGEILSPTIGAAVRKAVSAAFARLMQRFNEALERSLSLRSIQWRLEARRTGRPFAEVVLLRTLVYRVEQVFLIHTDTGLVLQHLAAEATQAANPDQVSSMLTAIDAFGKEAFDAKAPGAHLHELAMGDVTVYVDKGPLIALAVVVRGVAPRALFDLITETRERILLEHRINLTNFVADVTPFAATRPLLERCLHEQRAKAPRRGRVFLAAFTVALFILISALLMMGHSRKLAEERQLAAYRQTLSSEPGIVVTSATLLDGRYQVRGLRDPVAEKPAEILARSGQPPADLSFKRFYSLEPPIIEKRFKRLAEPPLGVVVEVKGGTLYISGLAPRRWIGRARSLASNLPGVERVEVSGLRASGDP